MIVLILGPPNSILYMGFIQKSEFRRRV